MDIKNLISGTISSIVGKVKDVAETSNVKETVLDIYDQGASKAMAYGHIAKLSVELLGDKDELKKLYTEIGRLYFEETQEPDEFFAPLFEQTRQVFDRIKDKEAIIAALKESDIEVECCCGEDCDCEGDDCCCEGDDCCCCTEEDFVAEASELEEVVEACEAEACGETEENKE